ncbi:hypothetical protein [Natronospora cellulosivora (SeqCode)]
MGFNDIFCGVVGNFLYDLFKKIIRCSNHKNNQFTDENKIIDNINNTLKLDNYNTENLIIKTISQRFHHIINMMNQGYTYEKYTVSLMAETMGLEKTGKLYNYVNGVEEPTFAFMDRFCQYFGVNADWLKNGNWTPFGSLEVSEILPLDYLKRIKKLDPNTIFFIRSKSDIGKTGIVLQINEFKYIYFPRIYHLSSHVGGTGRRQIFSFYKLIKAIEEVKLSSKCFGRVIEDNVFNDIFSGKLFSGIVSTFPNSQNLWWDDFTDVYHKYPIAENYERWYGKEFIIAQEIVKDFLDKKK